MKPSAAALALASTLREFDLRIVFAESCTAGLLSASLGAVEGISAHLCGSAVSYREQTKIDWLNVDAGDIASHTAVSRKIAEEMARGVLAQTPEAHISAATTGHLGPNAPPEQDGTVFISVAHRTRQEVLVDVRCVQLASATRDERQEEAVTCALAYVQETLEKCADPHTLQPALEKQVQPTNTKDPMEDPHAEQVSILQAILDTAVDAIISIDAAGLIHMANPSAEKMFGYAPNELLGKNVSELMPAPYRDEHDKYLRDYLKTGKAKIIGVGREVMAKRKDGSTFPIDLAVSESIVGERHLFTGVLRDLTEHKIAEERVAGLGRIVEHSMNEIYIFDAATLKFIQVNRGARENLGYSLDELSTMTPLDLKPDMSLTAFDSLVAPLRSQQHDSIEFETRHQRANGSYYDVEVHLQISTLEGQAVFVAIILDVTERKQAEARVLQAERLAAIGQMIAGLAHESRNAFQRIQACLEMLELDLTEQDESLDLIQRAQKALDHLHYLYEEVRNYAAPLRLNKSAVDLPAVWRETWTHLEMQRKHKEVELIEELPAEIPLVHIDAHAFEQVFRNLFENAIAACPDEGVIRIHLEGTSLAGKAAVCMTVTDNGPGFDEKSLTHIFDPFFTTKVKGTGLGMAITKRIVEAHDGTITLGNAPQGAEVTITIPTGAR